MQVFAAVALVSYLLGSIPFGYLLVRLFRGEDIRQSGSGNIGATNVGRKSPLLGLATLLLDAAKGWLAVELAVLLSDRLWTQGELFYRYYDHVRSLAALCAVAGHIFSMWLRFRGGKGVATAVGAYAALAPGVTAICLVIFVLFLGSFRFVSLASCTAIALFPLMAYLLHGNRFPPLFYGLSAAAAVLIVAKHRGNLERMLAGTEPRFGLKRN
ncbi:MAG: glycerol-3-phosphate 1-O-acyltransferase PlsY [Acidobacteria bacterium]|nr:glycerol-3-phosphate 1-O-acyltransferase PlsY [Acidobacteriota bacterium]